MTRKQALAELIAKVEAGGLAPVDLIALEPEEHAWAQQAYDGSLDAAKLLHEAMLPGWIWGRQQNGAMWVANRPYTFRATTRGNDPARAWLLAILRALHSMEPDAE